jgi:Mrp family chromosome partitioning ATPase
MESLLQQAKSRYDLIVVDTPPLTAVSDAFPLLSKVDGVIIVGRVGRNRRDIAQRLHETLTGAGAPLLGVVANGFKSGRLGDYGYGYSYVGMGTPTTMRLGSSRRPRRTAHPPAERLPAAPARPRHRCRPLRSEPARGRFGAGRCQAATLGR